MAAAAGGGSTLIPSVRYKDAPAAMAWLERALGFVRHAVYEGKDGMVEHAELRHGAGMIMIGSAGRASPNAHLYALPGEVGGRVTSPLYLVVADCDPVWRTAQAAGAEVVAPLETMPYGGRAFAVRDPEGYLWSVGEYSPWEVTGAAEPDGS